MDRVKYAFIMMSGTLTPEVFDVLHDTEGDYTRLLAVNSFKMAVETAKQLADEGYEHLDLCGAFNAEKAQKVRESTDGRLDVHYAKYSPEDDKRMNEMPSLHEFGIIMMDGSVPETQWVYEKHDEFNTTIAFVNSLEATIKAVRAMVEKGVVFVEMCRWYDSEKAAAVSEAINGAIPVGYCG